MKSRAHVGVLVDDDRPPTPLVWAVSSVEGSRHIWVSNVPRGLVIVRYPYFVLPIGCIFVRQARCTLANTKRPNAPLEHKSLPWVASLFCLDAQLCGTASKTDQASAFVYNQNVALQQLQ